MSESVMVKFEGSDRIDWVTPAKARQMLRVRKDKSGYEIPADATVLSKCPFVIRVRRSAARRYPHIVRWTASSGGHVMMGAGLMHSIIPVAERVGR